MNETRYDTRPGRLAVFFAALALVVVGCADTAPEPAAAPSATNWQANMAVVAPKVATSAGELESSSRLRATWQAPVGTVDHFVIEAVGPVATPAETLSVPAGETAGTIGLLRSSTSYAVTVRACLDADCQQSLPSSTENASTATETWQIQGSGESFASASHIVADGNTKASTIIYGEGAAKDLLGTVQLYYDTNNPGNKGILIATLASGVSSDPKSMASFAAVPGFGLLRQDSPQAKQRIGPQTFQVLPLSAAMGGKVRIFFEGVLAGTKKPHLYSVDSVDGYVGRDFHVGDATLCGHQEIGADGACPTSVALGYDDPKAVALREIRQAKVVYPRLDDWRWDGAKGTAMVVTLHLEKSHQDCSETFFNAGYAVWDGAAWKLQYDAAGCPISWPGVQAPMPVHLGGPRYKFYFNNNAIGGGKLKGMSDKPMKVMYGDARASGDSAVLDFADWENSPGAREVRYVWPTGAELSETEESRLDDYEIFAPTGDPSYLVMYSNMTCEKGACGPPFIGMAVWLNP